MLAGVGKLLSLASSVFGSKNVKKPRELIGVDLVMVDEKISVLN